MCVCLVYFFCSRLLHFNSSRESECTISPVWFRNSAGSRSHRPKLIRAWRKWRKIRANKSNCGTFGLGKINWAVNVLSKDGMVKQNGWREQNTKQTLFNSFLVSFLCFMCCRMCIELLEILVSLCAYECVAKKANIMMTRYCTLDNLYMYDSS